MLERGAAPGLVLGVSLLCGTAFASEGTRASAADAPTARAAALFDEGVAGLRAGHFETACPTLEQSHALEASLGTLLALADCLDRWQKPAAASERYTQFIDAVARASDAEASYRADQVAFAHAALARLQQQIPQLELTSSTPLPSDASVWLDGRELSPRARGGPLLLEPGQHVLETRAPGHEPRRVELALSLGEHRSSPLELGPVVRATAPAPEPPPASAEVVSDTSSATLVGDHKTPGSAWRTVGWGLGGLGLASVGVGAVAGTLLLQTCPGLDCAEHEERGKRLALITDLGLGFGLAALISSVIVIVSTEPPAKARDGVASFDPALAVYPQGGWFGMSHSF